MVRQMERQKESADRRAKLNALRQKEFAKSVGTRTLEEYAAEVEVAGKEQEMRMEVEEEKETKLVDKSRRKYFKELKRVIEESDVILQVLDARDPMGCRNKELESQIIAKNKRIILILNKIDLVPSYTFCPTHSEVAIQWCAHLRREYATVLFKANTQEQTQKLSNIKLNAHSLKENPEVFKKVVGTSKTVGGNDLMQIIKNYSRQGDVKTSITVGVIGFPNVGKSSVINSLKKTKVASVSNVPGHTKMVQEVYLDKNVRLLDCPGIVLSNENADSALLRNVIRVEDLPDPYVPVEIIAKKVSKEVLMKLYNVEDYSTTQELLASIARKRGRLLKGGVPDTGEAARLVLKDWNAGRVPFHTPCPLADSSSEQIIVGETMEMA